MTSIVDYPNPLLQHFSDQFGLGVTFDGNGIPDFRGNKVTPSQFEEFFNTVIKNEENFCRLVPAL